MVKTGIKGLLGKCVEPEKCDPKFRQARKVGPHSSTTCIHQIPANRFNLCTCDAAIAEYSQPPAEDGDPWVDGGTMSETPLDRVVKHLKSGGGLYLLDGVEYRCVVMADITGNIHSYFEDYGITYRSRMYKWDHVFFSYPEVRAARANALRKLADTLDAEEVEEKR